MTTQRPSIGRIVHYVNLGDKDGKYPPEVQAAVITGVYRMQNLEPGQKVEVSPGENQHLIRDGVIVPANKLGETGVDTLFADLHVLYRTGNFLMRAVPMAPTEEPARGHWHFPGRV